MLLFPAIDIRGGQCVRLRQGDYARETVFDDDPVAAARRWVGQGADRLHLVDLDGAKQGHPVNGDVIRDIVRSAGVPCQLGGGLRTVDAVEGEIRRLVDRALKDLHEDAAAFGVGEPRKPAAKAARGRRKSGREDGGEHRP